MVSGSRTLRRRWSDTLKKRVVSEASVTVTEISRRYDLDARRISNWQNKFGSGAGWFVSALPSAHGIQAIMFP
jgi:transposase-like protein